MCRRVLSFLFLLVMAGAAMAQSGPMLQMNAQPGVKLRGRSFADLLAAQKVLLSDYCRLDFDGARLQPLGWNRFKPFTSLRVNPEFTRVVIVTRFDIVVPELPSEELNVNFQTVGFYEEGEGYTVSASNDRVAIRVQQQSGDLLVTEVRPAAPHVSPRAAIAWMNSRLAAPATTELERAHLKDALDQLKRLFPQPQPAATTP
jgi:hypothetical protein